MLLHRRRYEPRRGRGSEPNPPLTISTDRLVLCPDCGDRMRLSEMHRFECSGCGRAITGEEALKICEQQGR